jgi:methyl-accepting chemotaxis protein
MSSTHNNSGTAVADAPASTRRKSETVSVSPSNGRRSVVSDGLTAEEAAILEAKVVSLGRAQSVLDTVAMAIMMIDRDFIVTYVNESTTKMLSKYAEDFRKVWPHVDVSKIVGSCIDLFPQRPFPPTPDAL